MKEHIPLDKSAGLSQQTQSNDQKTDLVIMPLGLKRSISFKKKWFDLKILNADFGREGVADKCFSTKLYFSAFLKM